MLLEAFLEARDLDIEAQHLRSKGMLSGQLVGPANSLLPRSWSHRAIMQLRLAAGNSMHHWCTIGFGSKYAFRGIRLPRH